MPEAYDVKWAQNGWGDKVGAQVSDSARMFMAARAQEQERRRKIEQEAYERAEQAKDRERQQKADAWQAERNKLDIDAAKLAMSTAKQKAAEHQLELTTKQALEQGQQFAAGDPRAAASAVAPQGDDAGPLPSPSGPEPTGGFAQAPGPVQLPAVPALEEGAPPVVAAQTVSPVQFAMQRARAAATAAQQEGESSGRLVRDEKGNLLPASVVNAREGAAQRAETARETASARAEQARQHDATLAAIAATKTASGEGGKPLLQGEANKVTELRQGLSQLRELKGGIGETGLMSGFKAGFPGGGNIMGAEERKRGAAIKLAKQMIGKALEGGVLRKEDEAKYADILPTMWDKSDVAQAKIDQLVVRLTSNYEDMLQTLEDVGRDTSKLRKRDEAKPPAGGKDPLGIR